jgi:zinc transport system substrate-binding protein
MKAWLTTLLFACLVMLGAVDARAEAPLVVASIKPIESLVAGVMEGVGRPELLVPGNLSPHTYSLRPSDGRKLAGARLVFWIGPIYEGFLVKPLESLAGKATIVRLMDAPGVELLAAREGGIWEPDPDEARGHHHPSELEMDGHLFLDPANAKAIVAAARDALAAADPADAARFTANAAAVTARLDALDAGLRQKLSAVKGRPFIVFHDAYQYLERRYGLAGAGSVTVSPETKPGAKRVAEIRSTILERRARCIFAEPQFEPSLVTMLTGETGARSGVLDPLGADIPSGPDLYFTLLDRLADTLARCLGS